MYTYSMYLKNMQIGAFAKMKEKKYKEKKQQLSSMCHVVLIVKHNSKNPLLPEKESSFKKKIKHIWSNDTCKLHNYSNSTILHATRNAS